MSNIAIFGAHGKIGQQLLKFIAHGTTKLKATAIVRNTEQKEELISSLSPERSAIGFAFLDLGSASVKDIQNVIKGHDAVIFTVGSRGKNLLQIDLDGAVKTFETSRASLVRRYIIVSALHANIRDFIEVSPLRNYYIAKHYADRILQDEFSLLLDYTIVRPTELLDGDGSGKIRLVQYGDEAGKIHRQDVARFILEALPNSKTFGKAYDISNGEESISEVIGG